MAKCTRHPNVGKESFCRVLFLGHSAKTLPCVRANTRQIFFQENKKNIGNRCSGSAGHHNHAAGRRDHHHAGQPGEEAPPHVAAPPPPVGAPTGRRSGPGHRPWLRLRLPPAPPPAAGRAGPPPPEAAPPPLEAIVAPLDCRRRERSRPRRGGSLRPHQGGSSSPRQGGSSWPRRGGSLRLHRGGSSRPCHRRELEADAPPPG